MHYFWVVMIHPKYIRYLKQALLFACIWFLFGLIYGIVEQGLLGRIDLYPSTRNRYDFKTSLTYASIGGFLMGFLHGWVEVTWLGKKFTKSPLWIKVVIKTLFYLLFIIIFLIVLASSVNSNRFDLSPLHPTVIHSVKQFMNSFAFWSVVIYIGFGITIGMLLLEISSFVGSGVFLNFVFGKYHTPKRESRIFMFLDMKSSTTIAEQLGHAKFFELLKAYYADMAIPILETSGEIYQYVGDEIVVTWPEKNGLYANNCIECFFRISKALEKRKADYLKRFNFFPSFKAGYHIGLVTTGEIGILKKEIIYTGDVLNTTARIQAECNNYDVRILLSEQLANQLKKSKLYNFIKMDNLQLRGKRELIQLYALHILD
ncbi:adenylate/guanylate cyclase domain-containing protein [Muricauda sp. CAU 1633]|uniref:adenylate/guanylate cyclase domain-containing protein n=1 Tax=Allomuricauda sp. CAU 1633 TaxID=2816036 RepID=UPI001A90451B|nr:adenylate/guanylate cyclase domain-containing protein [Muricauda sp. CAU 1633]MBO0322340.1 adenylate/guanylate cyclase domain-containing protein [Muricauda sp. CAU 1633]